MWEGEQRQGMIGAVVFELVFGLGFLWSGVMSLARTQRIIDTEVMGYREYRQLHPGRLGAVRAEFRYPNHRWMGSRWAGWHTRVLSAIGIVLGLVLLYTALTTVVAAHWIGGWARQQ